MKFFVFTFFSLVIYSQHQPVVENMVCGNGKQPKIKKTCLFGDCENGSGLQSIVLTCKKGNDSYYMYGNFKNGKLVGKGMIRAYFDSKNFENERPKNFDSLEFQNSIAKEDAKYNWGSVGYFIKGKLFRGTYLIKTNYWGINDYRKDVFNGYFDPESGYMMVGRFKFSHIPHTFYGNVCYKDGYPGATANCFQPALIAWYEDNSFKLNTRFLTDEIKDDIHRAIKDFDPSEYHPRRRMVQDTLLLGGWYTGEIYNGLPEGMGMWVKSDYTSFKFGFFKSGKLHGLSTQQFYNGICDDVLDPQKKKLNEGIALFKNNYAKKAYVSSTHYGYYLGQTDANMLPDGDGILKNCMDCSYEGRFSRGLPHGKIILYRGREAISAVFNQGKIESTGKTELNVFSLAPGDVVLIGNEKKMVVDFNSLGKPILHDGTILNSGDGVKMYLGNKSEFFKKCLACDGMGVLHPVATGTEKVLVGYKSNPYEYYKQGTDSRGNSVLYRFSGWSSEPVYEIRTVYKRETCKVCSGSGVVPIYNIKKSK